MVTSIGELVEVCSTRIQSGWRPLFSALETVRSSKSEVKEYLVGDYSMGKSFPYILSNSQMVPFFKVRIVTTICSNHCWQAWSVQSDRSLELEQNFDRSLFVTSLWMKLRVSPVQLIISTLIYKMFHQLHKLSGIKPEMGRWDLLWISFVCHMIRFFGEGIKPVIFEMNRVGWNYVAEHSKSQLE